MVRVTNDLGLPQALVQAIANDDYDRGLSDITVTQLLDPPRKVVLAARHADEIVEDASDRIYSLMGQAIHTVLERANVADSVEERLYAPVLGWQVGGKYDNLSLIPDPEYGHILSDYKNVSVWEVINGLKPERHAQLNILGWLARKHGYRVDRLEAVCIIRDWSKRKARTEENYPKKQVMRYFVPTWSDERIDSYVSARVLLHQQAHETLPECDDEERWYSGTTYALKKKANKRADRVFTSYDLAFSYAESKARTEERDGVAVLHKDWEIVERLGENRRCIDYCSALQFCEQGKTLLASTEPEADEEVA